MGDPVASDLDQMPGGHFSDLHVVGSNKMRRQMGKVAVEEEVWRAGIPQFIKVSQVRLARSDQENIHPRFSSVRISCRSNSGSSSEEQESARDCSSLNAPERFCELRKEGMDQIWNDKTDR